MNKRSKKAQPGISWPALKAEWKAWWSAKGPVLVYVTKFGALIGALYVLLALPFTERLLYFYLEANAWISSGILNILGQETQVSEVTIRSTDFAIAIRRGCDAVEPIGLLCAAIVAFPGTWGRKLTGMGVGIVILQALNLIRIVTLYLIGSRYPVFFSSAHLEIWPTVFIIVVITLFVGWKGWAYEK